MKFRSPSLSQFAFYGVCLVAAGWIVLTVVMETHFGIPNTPFQWFKRLLGWGVEFWLIRSLFLGIRRSGLVPAK
jgi:hypothetical protein